MPHSACAGRMYMGEHFCGMQAADMMLVGRLGDSLFAMPAPSGHGSTGIADPMIVHYPMNIDGCLGDEVSHLSISWPWLQRDSISLMLPWPASCQLHGLSVRERGCRDMKGHVTAP